VPNDSNHLNTAVYAEAERLLSEAKVWKLGNFGWLNAYDPDPELIGHAQWQTDPPIDTPLFGDERATYKPEPPEWLKIIAVAGADFEGLMEAARMSIGLLLLSIDAAKGRDFFDDSSVDLHRMSALMYLATASERLRELFVAAAFRRDQDKYNKSKAKVHGKSRSEFFSPFFEAAENFSGFDCLTKLIALVPDVEKMRKERNVLVHRIATEIAQRERESHARRNRPVEVATFEELQTFRVAMREHHDKKHQDIIRSLSGRYMLMVLASNEIFNFENSVRAR
jgi:hypothetical protein